MTKDFDEHAADDFAFLLRVGDAIKFRQKTLAGIDDMQVGLKMVLKAIANPVRLPLAQATVIHENAGELRTNRLIEDRSDNGGIDPSRQSADDAGIPHTFSNRRHFTFDQRTDLPGAPATADLLDEVFQQLPTELRVSHFGMELQAVDRLRLMLHSSEGAGIGRGQLNEIAADFFDLIAVAHPHGGCFRQAIHEGIISDHAAFFSPEFTRMTRTHGSTTHLTGELHTVTDTKNRNPELINLRIGLGGRLAVNTRRTARENQSLGIQFANPRDGQIVPHELTENIPIAHTSCNQLCRLATEIEDQDQLFLSGIDNSQVAVNYCMILRHNL